jgi:hypothetical protein
MKRLVVAALLAVSLGGPLAATQAGRASTEANGTFLTVGRSRRLFQIVECPTGTMSQREMTIESASNGCGTRQRSGSRSTT